MADYFWTQILHIATAPPGWNNIFLIDSEPWYELAPIALWADVFVVPEPKEQGERWLMGLSGISDIFVPLAPPTCIRGTGYCGVVHDDEITPAAARTWQSEAQWRTSNCELSAVGRSSSAPSLLSSGPKDAPATKVREARIPYGLQDLAEIFYTHHPSPGPRIEVLQRVPASPGWYNVYLVKQAPWFVLRRIILWMLLREKRPRFSPIWGFFRRHSLFETPRIVGIDGRLDFPGLGGSPGFLEMTHRSAITPAVTDQWVALARTNAELTQ